MWHLKARIAKLVTNCDRINKCAAFRVARCDRIPINTTGFNLLIAICDESEPAMGGTPKTIDDYPASATEAFSLDLVRVTR